MVNKICVYIVFCIAFWVPLWLLVKKGGFSETIALIAAAVGIVPFSLLFVPVFVSVFKAIVKRIKSIKIAGIEIDLLNVVEQAFERETTVQFSVSIDRGRESLHGKGNLDDFKDLIARYIAQPKKRFVLLLDLNPQGNISLPMVYFQSRILLKLFNLRALLFMNTAEITIDNRILGTMSPDRALQLINNHIEGIDKAFIESDRIAKDYQNIYGIKDHWNDFFGLLTKPNNLEEWRLSLLSYRNIFAAYTQRNILPYPLAESNYSDLLSYLKSGNDHLILIKNCEVVNVRTIDKVAREIVSSTLIAVIQSSSQVVLGEE